MMARASTSPKVATEPRKALIGKENLGLLAMLAALVVAFALASDRFLTAANLGSMGFQMPLLGLLTLAMLAPIVSGGLNLAIVYTANISGLTLAWDFVTASSEALHGPMLPETESTDRTEQMAVEH